MQVHFDGVTSCPFYFNGERDARAVGGPLAFCASCEKTIARLVKQGEVTVEAIEAVRAILGAYPPEVSDVWAEPPTVRKSAKRSTLRLRS